MTEEGNRKYFVDVFTNWVDEVKVLYDTENGVEPYSYYGSILEIINSLSVKDNNKDTKYPLVALVDDFKKSGDLWKPFYYVDPTIYIFMDTDKDDTPLERYTNVIKPILYVIRDYLCDVIKFSCDNSATTDEAPYEEEIFKGSIDGKPIPDTVDCIRIKFNRLQIRNKY